MIGARGLQGASFWALFRDYRFQSPNRLSCPKISPDHRLVHLYVPTVVSHLLLMNFMEKKIQRNRGEYLYERQFPICTMPQDGHSALERTRSRSAIDDLRLVVALQ